MQYLVSSSLSLSETSSRFTLQRCIRQDATVKEVSAKPTRGKAKLNAKPLLILLIEPLSPYWLKD